MTPTQSPTTEKMNVQPLLSIIVPVYNAGERISFTIKRIQENLSDLELRIMTFQKNHSSAGLEAGSLTRPESEAKIVATEAPLPTSSPSSLSLNPSTTRELIIGSHSSTQLIDPLIDAQSVVSTLREIANKKSSQDVQSAISIPRLSSSWYEIVIVNDGSTDNTREEVLALSSLDGPVRSISYSINMGKGYAIRQGVLRTKGKFVIFMDGDGDIGPDVLASYLEKLQDADVIVGSKYHPQSVVRAPVSRRILSRCFQSFVRIALGIKVRDTQVGLKAGKGAAFRRIFQKVVVKRYAFDAEMLAVATLLNMKIVEMPIKIDLNKRFRIKDILRMAIDVLGIAYRLRVIKWYQRN